LDSLALFHQLKKDSGRLEAALSLESKELVACSLPFIQDLVKDNLEEDLRTALRLGMLGLLVNQASQGDERSKEEIALLLLNQLTLRCETSSIPLGVENEAISIFSSDNPLGQFAQATYANQKMMSLFYLASFLALAARCFARCPRFSFLLLLGRFTCQPILTALRFFL